MDFIVEDAIVTPLKQAERDVVILELLDRLIAAGAVDVSLRETLKLRAMEREKSGSTGFGRGVAVPHVKHKDITRLSAAVGVSTKGVEFQSLDRQPVYTVFLLLSPEDKPDEHLQAMEALFKHLNKESFRRLLRQASTKDEVLLVLQEADQGMPGGLGLR